MKQYIDKADVVAEIERRIEEVSQIGKASYEIGLCDAYKTILSFLSTIEVKEENSEFLKKHFEETPQEELDKEWKEIEPLNDIGPDVLEYTNKK